jgi:hypothetical protein
VNPIPVAEQKPAVSKWQPLKTKLFFLAAMSGGLAGRQKCRTDVHFFGSISSGF